MFFIMLGIGFLAAIIAGASPGAVNVVVVQTRLRQSLSKTYQVILGASIGEVTIALLALHCTMSFSNYFNTNSWIQIFAAIVFLLAGIYFLFKNKFPTREKNTLTFSKAKFPKSFYGFLLAFLNPPVLIFWVLAFTLLNKSSLVISNMSPFYTILWFALGVFLGKITVLWAYTILGNSLKKKTGGNKQLLYKYIGVGLLGVGLIQGLRFII